MERDLLDVFIGRYDDVSGGPDAPSREVLNPSPDREDRLAIGLDAAVGAACTLRRPRLLLRHDPPLCLFANTGFSNDTMLR